MLTWNDIIAQIKHKKVIKRDNIENGEEEKKLIWINFNITWKYFRELNKGEIEVLRRISKCKEGFKILPVFYLWFVVSRSSLCYVTVARRTCKKIGSKISINPKNLRVVGSNLARGLLFKINFVVRIWINSF